MNPTDLASKLKLHPRAVLFTGNLRERTKNSTAGAISGFTPHYAAKGCQPVPYSPAGEPEPVQNEGAAIECDLAEQTPIMPSSFASYGKPLNMVHLIFGSNANQPNNTEYKLLREAGEILRGALGRPVHVAAVPVLSSGQYGVATGRLYLVGVFEIDGRPLFVHPNAVGSVLSSEFPAAQKIRSTQAAAPVAAQAPAAPVGPNWYDTMADTLATALRLKGAKLHEAVIATRAKHIASEEGITAKAAALKAQEQYNALKAASASTPAQTATPAAKAAQEPATPARRLSQARV